MNKGLTLIIFLTVVASACTTTGIRKQHRKQVANTSVVEVVDGDTVDIRFGEDVKTVRMLGVDTPEVHVENSPGEFEKIPSNSRGRQCLEKWGEKASEFAKKKLEGENISFVTDPNSDVRGSYGRLLGYIKVNGENFNYQLVRKGYARVYTSGFTKQSKFLEAEEKAQNRMKGLWQCQSFEISNLTVK
ncbi:MAG: thermonuclease family protein [Candidatus Nanohalobium sp.]